MKQLRKIVMFLLIVMAVAPFGIFAAGSKEQEGSIEFFQNKLEAVDTFDALVNKFNDEHPGITIEQNQVPDAETVLMTRLSSNNMPAVMGLNANAVYGEIAHAGAFTEWEQSTTDRIHEAYIDMTQRLVGDFDAVYGIPYSVNALTVLYNKEIFRELGLDVPLTWSEFVETCEQIKRAGRIPFFHTYKDAWTTMGPLNALAANLQGDDFFDKLYSGEVMFSDRYREIAEKMLVILNYGHDDNFGFGYTDGNQEFAHGKSAMYFQGIWAIGEITRANPDIELGVFALPAGEEAQRNRLVSGVDTILTVASSSQEEAAAKKFVNFLLSDEVATAYINEQNVFSAVKGIIQEDPIMQGIGPYFEEGRLAAFPDHYYPPSMEFASIVQEFLIEKDVDVFLQTLDQEYQKVMAR